MSVPDIVTAGLSKARILDMNTSFAATGASPNKGIPFIYADTIDVMLSVTAKNSDGDLYDYRILRALDADTTLAKITFKNKISDPKYKKSLNLSDPAKFVVALPDPSVDVYVHNLDNYLGYGNVIVRRKYKNSGSVEKGIDFKFPQTEKLLGLIPVQDVYARFYTNQFIAITVETSGDITDGTNFTNAKWRRFFCKSKFRKTELVGMTAGESGDVVGTVNINTFGFGRSAIYGTVCSVCEANEDGAFPKSHHIWTADGTPPYTVGLWEWNADNELVCTSSLSSTDGISDGSHSPAKPCIWMIGDVAFIISADILYAYRRATLTSDTSYTGTLTRFGPILWDETINSGVVDHSDLIYNPSSPDYSQTGVSVDAATYNMLMHGMLVKEGILRDWMDKANLMFFKEIVPKGYGIAFRNKKTDVDLIIPFADIGTVEGSADPKEAEVKHSRVMDNELPTKVVVNFKDPYRTYTDGSVTAESILSTISSVEDIDAPMFITRAQVDVIANEILKLRRIERDTFEFTLPFTYANLEPGDIIGLELPFDEGSVTVTCRIMKMKQSTNGIITLQVTATGNLTYTEIDADDENPPSDIDEEFPDEFTQLTQPVFLDIPVVYDTYDAVSGLPVSTVMLIEGASWGGATTYIYIGDDSSSSTATFTIRHSQDNAYKAAVVTGYLSASDCIVRELGTTLDINFSDNTIVLETSVDPFTNDDTLFAYGNSSTGWEICKYSDAELIDVDTNTWRLSGFMRGLYGTEHLTGTHSDGDLVVFLSPTDSLIFQNDIDYIDSSPYALGDTFYAQTIIAGQLNPPDEADRISCVYNGVNLLPYSGTHATISRSGGDITLSWFRRDRLENEWEDSFEIPMSEEYESYEVDIMNGSTVVRTKTSSTPTITYTAIQQTTDFGSPQNPVTFRIYQISAIVGRGTVYEVIL